MSTKPDAHAEEREAFRAAMIKAGNEMSVKYGQNLARRMLADNVWAIAKRYESGFRVALTWDERSTLKQGASDLHAVCGEDEWLHKLADKVWAIAKRFEMRSPAMMTQEEQRDIKHLSSSLHDVCRGGS